MIDLTPKEAAAILNPDTCFEATLKHLEADPSQDRESMWKSFRLLDAARRMGARALLAQARLEDDLR